VSDLLPAVPASKTPGKATAVTSQQLDEFGGHVERPAGG